MKCLILTSLILTTCLLFIGFFLVCCSGDKSGLIVRAWKLNKVEEDCTTLDSTSSLNDQYHVFLKNVIDEHKKHNAIHSNVAWLFKSDSTFEIIFKDNSNETIDNKWRIEGDTLLLAIWHNDFYLKFIIKKLSKDSLIIENDELGKVSTKLIFSSDTKD